MGYSTYITGEIDIIPPLTSQEFADSPYTPGRAAEGNLDVMLHIVEETVDTPDGTLTRRTATAIVPTWEDEIRAYAIVEHLQGLVDRHGAGRTFTGRLDGEGEDNADMWRLEVHNGRAVKVRPRISWPDGTETDTGRG